MHNKQAELYQEFRPEMKTGDVIAFSGKGRVSEIIKWKTGSPYSHVALVLSTDLGGAFGGVNVLVIESTTLNNLPDVKTGELIKGVQMQWLSKRLQTYDGAAWWGRVTEEITPCGLHNMEAWVRKKHAERTPYDSIQAIGAGVDLLDWMPGIENEPDFNSLFCSELVACAWQAAGLLDEDINASEMTPADIMKLPFIEKHQIKK